MKTSSACWIVTLMAGFSSTPVLAQAPAVSAQDVEARVLAARLNLRTGFIHLEATMTDDDRANTPGEGQVRKFQSDYKFWFTRDRLRLDLSQQELGSPAPARSRVECINYDGRGKDFVHDGGIKSLAYQGRRLRAQKDLNWLFDPRTIGYEPSDLNALRSAPRLERFGRPAAGREDVRAERVVLDGENAILISWKDVQAGYEPTHHQMWISPAQGHNVKRHVAWGNDKAGREEWKYQIDNTLKDYAGTWFVSRYEHRAYGHGRTSSETVKVVDAWFDRPEPLDAFALKTFNLKPGQGIWDKDLNKRFVYDGDHAQLDIEEELAKASSHATPLAAVPGTTNYWLVALCVAAAAVGSVLVFRLLPKVRPRPQH